MMNMQAVFFVLYVITKLVVSFFYYCFITYLNIKKYQDISASNFRLSFMNSIPFRVLHCMQLSSRKRLHVTYKKEGYFVSF